VLTRSGKAAFYLVAEPAMWLNGWLYRKLRAPSTGTVKAHLGPGRKNYIPGWVNVDANAFTARCDLWADLRHELPFKSETLDAVYSHHVIEHLPRVAAHFRSVYRCLKPGGVYRVGGPNGDSAIEKFRQGDRAWFGTFPDARQSLGGRLDNFLLCRNEHLCILTYTYVAELMEEAGFVRPTGRQPCSETGFPQLFGDCLPFEHESDPVCPHTLIVEGEKPA
jgi:SAM-dependent methyltransferase